MKFLELTQLSYGTKFIPELQLKTDAKVEVYQHLPSLWDAWQSLLLLLYNKPESSPGLNPSLMCLVTVMCVAVFPCTGVQPAASGPHAAQDGCECGPTQKS